MPDVLGIPCTSPDEASLNSHGTMAVGSSDSCPRQFEEITFLLEKMKLLAELLSREPIFFQHIWKCFARNCGWAGAAEDSKERAETVKSQALIEGFFFFLLLYVNQRIHGKQRVA